MGPSIPDAQAREHHETRFFRLQALHEQEMAIRLMLDLPLSDQSRRVYEEMLASVRTVIAHEKARVAPDTSA
jgi:hypothetical protein